MPHGFNQYGNVHNTVILSASNPSPSHFAFLKSRGLTADRIRIGIHASGVYQAVLRSSIRSQSDEPKNIIVPDFETADYLAHMFPGCKLEPIDIGISGAFKSKSPGRKRIYGSDAEKIKRHRERKRENDIKLMIELYALNQGGYPTADSKIAGLDVQGAMLCNETTNKPFISDIVTGPAIGTLYSDAFSSKPLAYCAYYSNEISLKF